MDTCLKQTITIVILSLFHALLFLLDLYDYLFNYLNPTCFVIQAIWTLKAGNGFYLALLYLIYMIERSVYFFLISPSLKGGLCMSTRQNNSVSLM